LLKISLNHVSRTLLISTTILPPGAQSTSTPVCNPRPASRFGIRTALSLSASLEEYNLDILFVREGFEERDIERETAISTLYSCASKL
jgi:hypothetical protein